jgi:hypothetical protein
MRILWFHLFSLLEWSALFSLGFAMFRFKLRDQIPFIVFCSLFISMFSYLMRDVLEMDSITPLIQLILLILVFKFMLRIKLVYAGIIVSFGYISYVSLNILVMLVFGWTSILKFDSTFLEKFNMHYLAALITAIMTFFIVYLLVAFRVGFTFVPKQNFRGNFPFWILIALAMTVLGVLLININIQHMQTVFIAATIVSGFLLYFLLKREVEQV